MGLCPSLYVQGEEVRCWSDRVLIIPPRVHAPESHGPRPDWTLSDADGRPVGDRTRPVCREERHMRKRLVMAMSLAAVLTLVPSAALADPPEVKAPGFWPEVEAQQRCELNQDGERVYYLYYAMEAWNQEGLPPDHRVNGMISLRVTDQADPDDEILLDWGVGYFDPENHYRFKDRRELDVDEPHTLLLRARAEVHWGPRQEDDDDYWDESGETRWLTVAPPAGCPGASASSSTMTPPATITPPATAAEIASNPECGLPGGTWTDANGDPPVYTPGVNYGFVIPGKIDGRVIYQGDNLPGDGIYDHDDRLKEYPDGHADHVDVDGDDYDDTGRPTGRRPCTAAPATTTPPPTTVAPTPSTTAPPPATSAEVAAAAPSSTPPTTAPPTTTTPPPTTVPPPPTTPPPSTTTPPLPASAEVAAAAPSPPTTAPPTTTASPPSTSVAVAAATPGPTPSGGNELPFTGSRGTAALIASLSLLLVGYLALRVTRRGAGAHLHHGE